MATGNRVSRQAWLIPAGVAVGVVAVILFAVFALDADRRALTNPYREDSGSITGIGRTDDGTVVLIDEGQVRPLDESEVIEGAGDAASPEAGEEMLEADSIPVEDSDAVPDRPAHRPLDSQSDDIPPNARSWDELQGRDGSAEGDGSGEDEGGRED
ncbi:MAG: hypothetical protein ACLFQL_08430 [Paracoccaceae bacterium]